MKLIITLFVIILCATNPSIGQKELSQNKEKNCLLDLQTGRFGTMLVGDTNLDSVELVYGKSTVEKRTLKIWQGGIFRTRVKIKTIRYDSLGITFTAQKKKGTRKFYLTLIEIYGSNSCRSSEGVGINSNYSELEQSLGPINLYTVHKNGQKRTKVMILCENSVAIIFSKKGKVTEENFKVEKIEILLPTFWN